MIQKTGRFKPRLYKQNPPTRVEEWAVKIILQYGLFQIVIARNEEDNTAVETASIQTKPADAG